MNNTVFEKTMENVRKRRDYIVSEQICHTRKSFSDNLLAIEIKRTQIPMDKAFYLGLSILEISKVLVLV